LLFLEIVNQCSLEDAQLALMPNPHGGRGPKPPDVDPKRGVAAGDAR
jgi:hypothetical protein